MCFTLLQATRNYIFANNQVCLIPTSSSIILSVILFFIWNKQDSTYFCFHIHYNIALLKLLFLKSPSVQTTMGIYSIGMCSAKNMDCVISAILSMDFKYPIVHMNQNCYGLITSKIFLMNLIR